MQQRVRLSRRFVGAVKVSPIKGYVLARLNGLHPSTLSMWLHDARDLRPGDERAIAIGRMVGVAAEECFEEATAVRGENPSSEATL
jgi:hypothetical protein